jgi:hypothetical protein
MRFSYRGDALLAGSFFCRGLNGAIAGKYPRRGDHERARGQVYFLWQFFVTVHIAIFALLFIYDHAVESLNTVAKFFAVLGVAAFEWINGNAPTHAYLLLDAMPEQFHWNYAQADRFHPAFYAQFVLTSYATRPAMVQSSLCSWLFFRAALFKAERRRELRRRFCCRVAIAATAKSRT